MLIAVMSPKGGVGTSTLSVAIAAVIASGHPDVRLVDFDGDAAAIIGMRLSTGIGMREWLNAQPGPTEGAIDALTLDVAQRFRYIPPGTAELAASSEASMRLAATLRRSPSIYVVDCGGRMPVQQEVAENADLLFLVVRPCFLALNTLTTAHRAVERSAGVIVVDEPHRRLSINDCLQVIGRPELARIALRPEVCRSIDAGVFLRQRPAAVFEPIERMCLRLGLIPGARLQSA